jgi:hypothetical protein
MAVLTEDQLNNLNKEALIILVSSLQSQLDSVQSQLDRANDMLAENIKQINLLTEQIRVMNQRHFGKKSESDLNDTEGQLTLYDVFNEAEFLMRPAIPEPEITEMVITSYKRSKPNRSARCFDHKRQDR